MAAEDNDQDRQQDERKDDRRNAGLDDDRNATEDKNSSDKDKKTDKDKKKEDSPKEKRKKRKVFLIFGIVLLIALIGGVIYYMHSRHFEDTDDAQVDGNLSPIGSKIAGTIIRVHADDNQHVNVGDLLIELDPRDQQATVDQAKAQVAQAAGSLDAQKPNVPITEVQASTNIDASKADVAQAEAAVGQAVKQRDQAAAQVVSQQAATIKAENDLRRYQQLIAKQEVSQQDYDQYVATAKQQEATLEAQKQSLQAAEQTVLENRAKVNQSTAQLEQNRKTARPQIAAKVASVKQQEANLLSAQAQLEQAVLNLTYTKIYAPVSGVVMKRAAQVGAAVSAGQQFLTIAQTDDIWVTGNFKETQLSRVRTGQKVVMHVDAIDRDFNGTIFTIGAATGSISSALPPENATGNYVKVIQRIPVRIQLDRDQEGHEKLRPGMSVEPKVRIY